MNRQELKERWLKKFGEIAFKMLEVTLDKDSLHEEENEDGWVVCYKLRGKTADNRRLVLSFDVTESSQFPVEDELEKCELDVWFRSLEDGEDDDLDFENGNFMFHSAIVAEL